MTAIHNLCLHDFVHYQNLKKLFYLDVFQLITLIENDPWQSNTRKLLNTIGDCYVLNKHSEV